MAHESCATCAVSIGDAHARASRTAQRSASLRAPVRSGDVWHAPWSIHGMPKAFEHWKVLPHGKLTKLDDRLLGVTGELQMPITPITRRMTVARLDDGRLVIFSAIALHEDEMKELEEFGRPSFLIVPSDIHRLDAKIWKDRYPELHVIAPEGARKKVEEVVRVDSSHIDFGDPHVRFVTVPGTGGHEAALIVEGSSGTTLVLNDIVGNIRDAKGIGGWFLKLAGFAGDRPQIPRVVKKKIVGDQRALREQLLEWSGLAALKRIIVSHGSMIEDQPAAVLRKLAVSLV